MELFKLLAKLTLDTNEFSKYLDQAEKDLKAVDAPEPKLDLDSDGFNSKIEESQSLGTGFGSQMESVFKTVKTTIEASGAYLAIKKIVGGLRDMINMTAETADGIEKGAAKLGISQKAYQEWDHALKQSGSSIDVVKKGIMQFQLAMKAVDPNTMFDPEKIGDQVDGIADQTVGLSTDAYEALRDLGLLTRMTSGEFEKAEDLMNATLLALAGYEGTTDERGLLTRALFGRGGDELNALLNEGEEGVKSLLTEASDLGLIMTDEEIANATAYGDAVDNLNAELAAIKEAFVADIIPVLTEATKWLTDFLAQLNPRLQTSSIFDVFEQIDAKALVASMKVDEANATAKKLIEDLQQMGDYWSLDEEGRMTWDALAAKALELFPQLSQYINNDGKKIQGNTQDIEANIDAWARLEKQRLLSAAMDEKSEAVAKQLIEAYEKGAEAAGKEAEIEGKRLTAYKAIEHFMNEGRGKSYKLGDEPFVMTDELWEQMGGNLSNWINEMGSVEEKRDFFGWKDTEKEAQQLREEADNMISEAKEAQATLDEYEQRLGEQMGLTTEQIIKAKDEAEKYSAVLDGIPREVITKFNQIEDHSFSHAIGSAYIPYDNYPALLHRGEKVLTATEARQESSSSIDYSALEDRISAAIRAGMDGVTVNSYLNGKAITDEVNRNTITDVKNRRFRS